MAKICEMDLKAVNLWKKANYSGRKNPGKNKNKFG